MRIYELARSLRTSSQDILDLADKLDLEAHSPLSSLDEGEIETIRKQLSVPASPDRSKMLAGRLAKRQAKAEAVLERRQLADQQEASSLRKAIERAIAIEESIEGVKRDQPDTAAPPAGDTITEEAAPGPAPAPEPPASGKTKDKAQPKAKPDKATPYRIKAPAETEEKTGNDLPARQKPRKTQGREQEASLARAGTPRVSRDKAKARPAATSAVPEPPPREKAAFSVDRVIRVRGPVLVKELAELMDARPNQIIAELMRMNVLASINQRVDVPMAERIAERHGFTLELERQRRSSERRPTLKRDEEDDDIPEDTPDSMQPRPPVVTFLGHVDHGKTSLLDGICNKKIASGEDGGITQHIGAYTVQAGGRNITFLDTPGHAAFSSMRARGAGLTDIAVIVIAADDGVMPQTKEAIKHARDAGVTLMVAINKIDLPGANPDRIRQQLQTEGLTPEEWGGDLVCCEVSALKGTGVDHLLEMILLQADVLELAANPERRANGFIVEARLEQGRGPTATVLIAGGTLVVGDVVLCGRHWGRIRSMMNDQGNRIKKAGPGIAVQALGLSGVPEAGSEFRVMRNDKRARALAEQAGENLKEENLAVPKANSLDALMSQISGQSVPELSMVLKGDTQGSLEAVDQSLREIKTDKVVLNIIHGGLGNVTAADIQRAATAKSMIVGFHVSAESGVQSLARHHGIKIRLFRIIYELIDQIKMDMIALLPPEFREAVLGRAEVRQVFNLNRLGNVAGSLVVKGVMRANAKVRVLRGQEKVYDGGIASLRHFQTEVDEVREAQECGIRLVRFEEIAPGDIIECYHFEQLEKEL